jgi:hypothetical protein
MLFDFFAGILPHDVWQLCRRAAGFLNGVVSSLFQKKEKALEID